MVLVNGLTLEESRTKRLEKQQSRYRHRFGTFVPTEHNPLLDALLARGVNGESPSPQKPSSRRSSRKSIRSWSRARSPGEADQNLSPKPVKRTKRDTSRKRVVNAVEGGKVERAPSARSKSTRGKDKNLNKAIATQTCPHNSDHVDPQSSSNRAKQSKVHITKTKASTFTNSFTKSTTLDDVSGSELTQHHTSKPSKKPLPEMPTKSRTSLKRKSIVGDEDDKEDVQAVVGQMKKAKTSSRRPYIVKNAPPDIGEHADIEQSEHRMSLFAEIKPDLPGPADVEEGRTDAEAQSRNKATSEKKLAVNRKRKKIETQDQDQDTMKTISIHKPNARSRKENTIRAKPTILGKQQTKPPITSASKFPKPTRFGSPLRLVSDDDEDPIDFLS